MRFKWKLFFSYLLITLIPFIAAERYIAHHLKGSLLNQTENRLLNEALLLKTIIERENTPEFLTFDIDRFVKLAGKDIGERITFINAKGSVLGDTGIASEAVKDMEDHSNRPEFISAFRKSHGMAIRHSTTLEIDMMYLAVKVKQKGSFAGVVRVSLPLTKIKKLIHKTELTLVTAFITCVLFILILNIFVSRKISKPIEEITQVAKAISGGDFDVKVYSTGKGELEALGDSVNVMAREIKWRIHEITQEKQTLATILRDMSDGVMVVDARGRIVLVNSVLKVLLGKQFSVVGKTPVEIIRSAQLQDCFAGVLKEGGTFKMELTVPTSGPDKILDVTATALKPEDRTEGAIAVFHDISELKRIDMVRKDFVANVSHELRTPLTSVKGYAETLSEGKIEDFSKITSFAGIILKHANRLSALVDDLLSLTHLESDTEAPAKKEMDLKEVLESVVLIVKPSAEGKDLTIDMEAVPRDLKVFADRDRISQALINLLDNAVKYTPKGGLISVSATEVEEEIHITVADTGIGIPKEDLDRIFERFYRVDKNRSRKMGGTGLGLSIVKHIVKGHGGSIWVQSISEEGSAFTFSLPKNQIPISERL